MKLARSITLPRRQAVELSAQMTLSSRYLDKHPEVIDTWEGYLAQDQQRRRGMLGQAAAVLRHDCWARLPHLRAQTLVLVGDADTLVPPQNSHILAERIPSSRLRILKGVGHDLTTEAPSKCALYILDFLERG
jgi:pimeloyl-ACP methyl ester carboxylesterase